VVYNSCPRNQTWRPPTVSITEFNWCAEYAGEGLWRADQPATEEYILDLRYHDHTAILTVTSTRSNYNRSLWINTVEFIHDARRHDYSRCAGRATRVRLMNPSKKKIGFSFFQSQRCNRESSRCLHSHNIGKESSRLRNGRFLFLCACEPQQSTKRFGTTESLQ
jgi:hypothetical protein